MGQQVAAKGVTVVEDGHDGLCAAARSRSTTRARRPTAPSWIEDGILVGYMQELAKCPADEHEADRQRPPPGLCVSRLPSI